jgi:signal transduction histidine kinase
VDKTRFEELFENIITNAIKYTKNIKGIITIDAKEEKDSIVISVNDNGIGLTESQMNHIFDEFYKVDQARHDLSSHGLGLSICKRIIEKHGGRIWVESQGLGKGSTFYFTLRNSGKK